MKLQAELAEPEYAEQAFIQVRLAHLAYARGEYAAVQSLCQKAMTLCDAQTGLSQAASCHLLLARVTSYTGKRGQAKEHLLEALNGYRTCGDRQNIAHIRHQLGVLLEKSGDLAGAEKLFRENLPLLRQLNDWRGLARAYSGLANMAAWREAWPEAIRYYEDALSIYQEIGEELQIGVTLGNLGTIYHAMGAYDQAQRLYEASLALSHRLDDRLGETYTLLNLGEMAFDRKEWAQSGLYLQQALETAVALEAVGRTLNVMGMLARTLAYAEDREMALALLLFVTQHPACSYATREQAVETLAALQEDELLLAAVEERARGLDLDTAVAWCAAFFS